MTTFDNREVVIPNGSPANFDSVNITANPTRRIDINAVVSYDTDLKKARTVIFEFLKNDNRVHAEPKPMVWLNNFGDSSLDLVVRAWDNKENF